MGSVRTYAASIAAAALLLAAPAFATEPPPVSFGDDSGAWAKDGECDDPRFIGEGAADALMVEHIGRDASDCSTAWIAGTLEFNMLFMPPSDERPVDYGDDNGSYPNDGACDDVRFVGDYSDEMVYLVEDIGHDASDCLAAVESGAAKWQGGETHPNIGQKFV